MAGEVIYETQEALDEALAVWQQILGLRDWEIEAKFARQHDFDDADEFVHGSCNVDEAHRSAAVKIAIGDELPPDTFLPCDHERTLVHELLHIHFKPLEHTEYDRRVEVAEEQAINAIALGFVTLKRRMLAVAVKNTRLVSAQDILGLQTAQKVPALFALAGEIMARSRGWGRSSTSRQGEGS